ncbi:MAG: hypothetical protein GDA55_02720 [Cellvibrionales bacterium]|nr:hypothetical protein [Cellvibrionales bacterium]
MFELILLKALVLGTLAFAAAYFYTEYRWHSLDPAQRAPATPTPKNTPLGPEHYKIDGAVY